MMVENCNNPAALMQQVGDVLEVSSLPSQSMHMVLSLRGGQASRYLFQTNHDAIIFQTTLLQVARHGSFMQNRPAEGLVRPFLDSCSSVTSQRCC